MEATSGMACDSWDLVVIGAGAAGLLGAAKVAEAGFSVLLIEKNNKPGIKILMSGGTRCNLTQNTDAKGIVAAFGKEQGPFLHSALAALGPHQLRAMVEAEGVPLKVEPTGKVFPESNSAVDIQQAFLKLLKRSGATLSTGEAVSNINRTEEQGWVITTSQRVVHSKRLLLTTGGKSYPGCGTTGDGYRWLALLGHTIVPPRPALVPLEIVTSWVRELSGITIPDVLVAVHLKSDQSGKPLSQYRGSFLFTHFGCSGPSVLNVSRAVSGHSTPADLLLVCDWLPSHTIPQLEEAFKHWALSEGRKTCANMLSQLIPGRLVEQIMHEAKAPMDRRCSEVSKAERSSLMSLLKGQRLAIHKSLGFEKAEVTAGGVSLKEVDSRNMRSKLVPNLWLAGEILDLDGPIGGYNFQSAFSTGHLAALDICGLK